MTAELKFTPEQEDKLILLAHQSWLDAHEKNSGPLDVWHEAFESIFEIQMIQQIEKENLKFSHIRKVAKTLTKLGVSKTGRIAILNAVRDKGYNYFPTIAKRSKLDISPWLDQHNTNSKAGYETEITGLIFLLRYREIGSQSDVLDEMAYSSVDLSELEPWGNGGQFTFKSAETIRQNWLRFRRDAIHRGFVDTRCCAALLTDSLYPERPLRFSDFPA